MVIKAVLFDMDGTIIDSEPLHTKILQDMVKEKFNIDLTEKEILEYIGISYKEKLKKLLEKKLDKFDARELDGIAVKKSLESSHLIEKINGSEEIIKKMKENFKVAVVTGSSREQAEIFLKDVDLKKYFEVIVSRSDVEKNKPYPDSYLLAAEKLGLEPKECIVIEDSPTGLEAAKNAGMFCIVAKNEYNKVQDFSDADKIIDNIKEINLEMIRNLD